MENKLMLGLVLGMIFISSVGVVAFNFEDPNYGLDYENPHPNLIHGEMWNYTSGGWLFHIDANDVYYNLTGLIAGNLDGFTFTSNPTDEGGSFLMAQIPGLYKMSFSMSFTSEAAGGLYGISIAHDYDPDTHRDCYSRRSARTDIGSISVTCLMDLDTGDKVVIMVENENTNRDITVYTANLNVVRIGANGH